MADIAAALSKDLWRLHWGLRPSGTIYGDGSKPITVRGLMWCCTSINQSILGYDAIVLTHSHVNIGMNMIVYNMYIYIYIYSYCYRYIEIYVCDSICISEYRSANMIVFSLHERLIQNEKIHLRRCFTATAPRFLSPFPVGAPLFMGQYS